jgi:site-specific DNA-cytosine methylase
MCNRVKEHVYTVFFAFAGIGGGAIGFQQAAALEKFGLKGRFRVIGAFDFDAGAAADFERLTGVPCEVVDVRKLTVKRLRALCPRRPDVVFGSAPCKGASPLLGNELAETEKAELKDKWLRAVAELENYKKRVRREIDDATWVPETYDRISIWGHRRPGSMKNLHTS